MENKLKEEPLSDIKGLYIRIPAELHQKAKECALMRNITLSLWVNRLIVQGIMRDGSFDVDKTCVIRHRHCHCGGKCNEHCDVCHIDCDCLD